MRPIFMSVHSIETIHRESKKGDTTLLSISLPNIDWFSQFFHRRTQLELRNKIVNKDPTSHQICCYTTRLPGEIIIIIIIIIIIKIVHKVQN